MQTPSSQVWKEPCPSDHISAFGCCADVESHSFGKISPHSGCQACRRNFDLSFQESRPGRYLQKHTKTTGVPTITIQKQLHKQSLSFYTSKQFVLVIHSGLKLACCMCHLYVCPVVLFQVRSRTSQGVVPWYISCTHLLLSYWPKLKGSEIQTA